MKEKITPDVKPVGKSDFLKDGGHQTLTTPKIDTNGKYWNEDTGSKDKILK